MSGSGIGNLNPWAVNLDTAELKKPCPWANHRAGSAAVCWADPGLQLCSASSAFMPERLESLPGELALGSSPGTPVWSTWLSLAVMQLRRGLHFCWRPVSREADSDQVNPLASSIFKELISVFVNFLVLFYFIHVRVHFYYFFLFVLVLFLLLFFP